MTCTFLMSMCVLSTIFTLINGGGGDNQKSTVTSDVCEYDIDLKKNTFHAKCRGQPLGVNVYANSASVNTGRVKQVSPGLSSSGQSSTNLLHSAFLGPPVDLDNATTALLKNMKNKLDNQKAAISNISHLLSRGDNDLRSDLQALRGLKSDESAVRESIIATMRNQYNFMRTAILAHNAELGQVLDLLETLVGMTSSAQHQAVYSQQALQHQFLNVNRTMLAMRTTFSSCLRKCQRKREPRKKDQCPRTVSAFGAGEALQAPWDKGVVMTDSAGNSNRMWIMAVKDGRDQLRQYDSRFDIQYELVSRYFSLPFFCEGTGHVVYRNALFCHKSGTRIVTKYNLKRMEVSAEVELPSAGVSNTFPYQFGLQSDIDLAVDEVGLWVIYSTKESAGKIVISKLQPRSLAIEKTWLTSFPKKMVGNSFMICGVLYATNSYQDTPTFIRYIYDTNTQQEAKMEANNLIFNNAVGFNSSKQAASVMLDYSPNDHKLYSWSNGQILIFPVYFKND